MALRGLYVEVTWGEWVISWSRGKKEVKGQFLFSLVCQTQYMSFIVEVSWFDQDREEWVGQSLTVLFIRTRKGGRG